MATILAIESSCKAASVAVVQNGEVIFESLVSSGLVHSQTLMIILKNGIDQSKFEISDVDLIAVAIGPGSFTGLRIGVSVAKGLGIGLGVRCVGVSTLRSLAVNLINLPVIACAVIDARNDFVYCGLFDMIKGELGEQIGCDEVILIDDLFNKLKNLNLKKTVVLIGDGAVKCYNKFHGKLSNVVLVGSNSINVRASSVALCAQADLKLNKINTNFKLNYLRQSQAQRLMNKKIGEKNLNE